MPVAPFTPDKRLANFAAAFPDYVAKVRLLWAANPKYGEGWIAECAEAGKPLEPYMVTAREQRDAEHNYIPGFEEDWTVE